MFGTLGGPELFLIFVVALIVFGPRKLPDIGKSLGKMMAEFRRASNDFRNTIETEVETEKIRESMRIEPPRVDPVKGKKGPSAADPAGGTEDSEASQESGDGSEDADAPASGTSGATSDDADGAPEPPSTSEESKPKPDTAAARTPGESSAQGEGSVENRPAEPVPSTVSREPSSQAPESK